MPVRYPLTVLAMGFLWTPLRYASFTTRGLASKNSFCSKRSLQGRAMVLACPRNGRQCIQVRCIAFRRFPVGFFMTTFGSSEDNLSPAFGRILDTQTSGFLSICLT